MDSIHGKDHVIAESRWVGTAITWKMAKLDDLTEGGESHRLKKRASPSLELTVSDRIQR